MSQKLPVDGFEWMKGTNFIDDLIKSYNGISNIRYILATD